MLARLISKMHRAEPSRASSELSELTSSLLAVHCLLKVLVEEGVFTSSWRIG
jgi:hypothetical protein